MSPQIATLLCVLFILYLFWMDLKEGDGPSPATWIPLLWLFLASSRYVTQWLDLGAPATTPAAILDGSPMDAVVFLVLILAGVRILVQRRVDWVELLLTNPWIWMYFFFGVLSITWSDYPDVSFKRWFKATGNVIMALIILTEQRPYVAVAAILRRLAFLLVPLSFLFVKYYPDLGRVYGWGGRVMYTGVASQKNGLGLICLLSGIYLCWHMLLIYQQKRDAGGKLRTLTYFALAIMTALLFSMADSATSLVCLAVAAALFLISAVPILSRQPRWIVIMGVSAVFALVASEMIWGMTDHVIEMLGRDSSLTTRIPMWNGLLKMVEDPIMGVGYESFWLGDRLSVLTRAYGVRQAHNGYLEIYLNLGMMGLFLFVGSIVHGLMKVRRFLEVDYLSAILRLCFIVVVLLYNWTEATFYGVSSMWALLLLGIMDPPRVHASDSIESSESEQQPV
jgi:exopolysaccharide production protein ExoQ